VSDVEIVRGLRERQAFAANALVGQYGPYVRRVLFRVMGTQDPEHEDLVQEVFTRAIAGIKQLTSPGALRAWLTQIAVFTARGVIRHRRRSNWLMFLVEVPDQPADEPPPSVREAAGCVYQILDQMPVDERIPYSLRLFEGMDLAELATACGVSVATVRRRLARAEARFARLAAKYEALAPWVRST
jgi:RNA polymerase sigma-70 factor (ECF subfamily)